MPFSRCYLLCLVVFVGSPLALAQQAQQTQHAQPWLVSQPLDRVLPQPVRDPKAVSIVQKAIDALGGSAIGQFQSWKVQAQLQGTALNGNKSGTVTWEAAGMEYRLSSTLNGASNYTVSGHGKPATMANGAVKQVPKHVARSLFSPAMSGAVLYKEFQDSNYSVRFVATRDVNGVSANVIYLARQTNGDDSHTTPQTWYFDANTGLPLRLEYRMIGDAGPRVYIKAASDFSNWRNVSGTYYPFQIVDSRMGRQYATVSLQSVSVNPSIATTDFDAPAATAATGGAQ